MAERTGVTRQTYGRTEKGDPTVAIGTYPTSATTLAIQRTFDVLVDRMRLECGYYRERTGRPAGDAE